MDNDTISRQAAIDFIKAHSYPVRYNNTSIEQGMTITGMEQALNEMPSVKPGIPNAKQTVSITRKCIGGITNWN